MNRADIDDASWLVRVAQSANKSLRQEKGAFQIHVENLVVIALGHVPESRLLFKAGVIHQNVAAAIFGPGFLHQRLDLIQSGDVGLKAARGTPGFSNG